MTASTLAASQTMAMTESSHGPGAREAAKDYLRLRLAVVLWLQRLETAASRSLTFDAAMMREMAMATLRHEGGRTQRRVSGLTSRKQAANGSSGSSDRSYCLL
jgi:hypothetical protein